MPENTQKEKEEHLHFACIVPSPRLKLLIAKRELPGSKEFPLPGEKGGCSASPAFCGSLHKEGPTLDSPHPEARKVEMNRRQLRTGKGQWQPVRATWWEWPQFPGAYSAGDPNSFCSWRNQRSAQPSWRPCRFHHWCFLPISLSFADANSLNTSLLPPPYPLAFTGAQDPLTSQPWPL